MDHLACAATAGRAREGHGRGGLAVVAGRLHRRRSAGRDRFRDLRPRTGVRRRQDRHAPARRRPEARRQRARLRQPDLPDPRAAEQRSGARGLQLPDDGRLQARRRGRPGRSRPGCSVAVRLGDPAGAAVPTRRRPRDSTSGAAAGRPAAEDRGAGTPSPTAGDAGQGRDLGADGGLLARAGVHLEPGAAGAITPGRRARAVCGLPSRPALLVRRGGPGPRRRPRAGRVAVARQHDPGRRRPGERGPWTDRRSAAAVSRRPGPRARRRRSAGGLPRRTSGR